MLLTPKKGSTKAEEEKKTEEEKELEGEEISAEQLAAALGLEQEEEMRVVGLYGDIDERKSRETLSGLLVLHHSGKSGEEGSEVWEPMDMIISTYGGSADDMLLSLNHDDKNYDYKFGWLDNFIRLWDVTEQRERGKN